MNPSEQFLSALSQAGIPFAGPVRDDGKIHRYRTEGDGDANCWYVLYPGDHPGGAYGCWKRNFKQNWSSNGSGMSGQQLADARKQWTEESKKREKETAELHERRALAAQAEFAGCAPASADHPYLLRKRVGAVGDLRLRADGRLLLGLRDVDGRLWNFQTIDADGDKLFMPGGKVSGCFNSLCDRADGPLVVCEGYATGATIHEATGYAVVAAMNCGNLLPVTEALRKKFPSRTIILAADDDRVQTCRHCQERTPVANESCEFCLQPHGQRNAGLEKSTEAAARIKGILCKPVFRDGSTGTDFNDLALEAGLAEVEKSFARVFRPVLSLLSASEIFSIRFSDADRILGDHMLDLGSHLTLLGQGGAGKSRLVFQLIANALRADPRFLSFDLHPGASSLRWLVFQQENSPRRLQDDLLKVKAFMGDAFPRFDAQVRVLSPMNEADTWLNLDNPDNLLRMQSALDWFLPDVVVFDSLYDFSAGDLNKDQDMKATLTGLTRLARHRNPKRALIVLHHARTGSGGQASAVGMDRSSFARNSKVIYNWSRCQVNVTPLLENSSELLSVSCGKLSDGREFPPVAVRLNPETMIYECDQSVDVAEVMAETREGVRPGMSPARVRELCEPTGSTKKDLCRLVMDDCGCSRSTAYRSMEKAEEKGQIKFSDAKGLFFRN